MGWGEETIGTVTYPYWIIKNSWGTTWWVGGRVVASGGPCGKKNKIGASANVRSPPARRGELGYVRMARKKWTTNPYNEGNGNFAWEGIYSASYVSVNAV